MLYGNSKQTRKMQTRRVWIIETWDNSSMPNWIYIPGYESVEFRIKYHLMIQKACAHSKCESILSKELNHINQLKNK